MLKFKLHTKYFLSASLFIISVIVMIWSFTRELSIEDLVDEKTQRFTQIEGLKDYVVQLAKKHGSSEGTLVYFVGRFSCNVYETLQMINESSVINCRVVLVFHPSYEKHDLENFKQHFGYNYSLEISPSKFQASWDEIAGEEHIDSGYSFKVVESNLIIDPFFLSIVTDLSDHF